MSQVAELSPSVVKLCKALKGKKLMAVSELDKETGDPSILADALSLDLIQIGNQNYSRNITESRFPKGPDGKTPLRDENGRQVVSHVYQTHLDNDWSWMTAKNQGTGRMPLQDVLAEDRKDLPPFHVRLTTAGLAAAAGRAPQLSAV